MHENQWQAVLAFIDAHVEENTTIAEIAAVAGYSPYHFNRMFGAYMGASIMDYMRMRKLQHAASHVIAEERLIDTALRYGFASHEGFTRAFTRHYGMSPQRFRRLHVGTYQVPPHHARHGITKGEIKMEPRKVTLPSRTLIGYKIHTQPGSAEIPALWASIMGDARWQRLHEKAAPRALNYGLCIHPAQMPEGQMDYMIAYDYDGESPVDADMTLFTLVQADYMAFPVEMRGDEETSMSIKRCWTEIYAQWFPASGYAYDSHRPDFEAYDGAGNVEIYIPLANG